MLLSAYLALVIVAVTLTALGLLWAALVLAVAATGIALRKEIAWLRSKRPSVRSVPAPLGRALP